ncbi:TSUP family transporter [Halomonas campisalis]|uniref:Probable membrane transporter protein n=1 Tax=Billgrantia campisalis TaxID=74661 RepID=A0ABS9PD33_9GAMM|nr:TSUP family transporter [Halomonas campisalis]MCG6659369.1 TSUP family transporter [Halomonas campisalis]MDR5863971.1 TSUP family transporter [Halomonas campisalis]
MALETLLAFLLIAALAGYFQTVTGFGLGMIVMGATSGLGIAPVASVAAVVSLMTLINCLVALPGRLQHVDWPSAWAAVAGIVPMIMVGVLLLDYLSGSAATLLSLLLGVVVLYGGASLLLQPSRQQRLSSRRSFALFGGLSGLLGGLFGMAGPPLIYHCYRQPIEPIRIRNLLILLFAATSGVRTLFVVSLGQMTAEILWLTVWSVPVIALATYAGRRFPLPFSPLVMRRIAFLVLLVMGVSLIASALA